MGDNERVVAKHVAGQPPAEEALPAPPIANAVEMLLIPMPIAQALVDYLKKQPYEDVETLIKILVNLRPAQKAEIPDGV